MEQQGGGGGESGGRLQRKVEEATITIPTGASRAEVLDTTIKVGISGGEATMEEVVVGMATINKVVGIRMEASQVALLAVKSWSYPRLNSVRGWKRFRCRRRR
jgi:hypothetical protein